MKEFFLYKSHLENNNIIREYFGGLLKTKRLGGWKHIYLFGKKFLQCPIFGLEAIRVKVEDGFKQLSINNQRLVTASVTNQKAFAQYRGAFRGKSVVLVAAGPTVNKFEPIKEAIYVGCNRAFKLDKIHFDFLFSIDKAGIDQFYDEFFAYDCIKFIGDQNLGEHYQISENKIPINEKTYRYITNAGTTIPTDYPLDISTSPLHNPPTVSLQALQFILYTQPSKVYIVGVDCTVGTKGHFVGKNADNTKRKEDVSFMDRVNIDEFKKFKQFAKTYYPDTEIISVNPVGLKGLFKDIYTDDNGKYVDENGLKIDL